MEAEISFAIICYEQSGSWSVHIGFVDSLWAEEVLIISKWLDTSSDWSGRKPTRNNDNNGEAIHDYVIISKTLEYWFTHLLKNYC